MYGKAKGLKIEGFSDYVDGSVSEKINKFLEENEEITVLDVKYTNTYHDDDGMYGTEKALLIYRA